MDIKEFIKENEDQIARVCTCHNVRCLELFGSGSSGGFDSSESDLDFLVNFNDLSPDEYAEAYFGLLEDLEDLFKLPVDLVMISAVKNPYFMQNINSSRIVLYAS